MKGLCRLLLFLLFLTLYCGGAYASDNMAASGPAWRGKVATSLFESLADDSERDVLVMFENQADLSEAEGLSWLERGRFVHRALLQAAEREQAVLIALLESNPGSYRSYNSHIVVNAVTIRGLNDSDLLEPMARLNSVSGIMEAETLDSGAPVSLIRADAALTETPWGIQDIQAPALWDLGVKGQGIVMGSIDTGVRYTHEALASNYRGGEGDEIDHNYNWFDAINGSSTPVDGAGHGTHTTGTVLGAPPSGIPIGVAPEAKWIACRACDGSTCEREPLLTCMDWMLAPWPLDGSGPADGDPDKRPHVVNNSWGGSCTDAYDTAMNNWRAAGIFPSFSSGNDGPNCETIGSPAGSEQAFATGAHDYAHGLLHFSSRGPACSDTRIKPDLTGPGSNVYSAWYTGDDGYYYAGGTSMSAPHTTGAVALLWSAKPWLIGRNDLTAQALRDTAHPVSDESCDPTLRTIMEKTPNYSWGYGRLDVLAAYNWRSASIAASPERQRLIGTNGQTLDYTITLYNQTDKSVAVGLAAGDHSWNVVLSADSIAVPAQGSASFTVSHAIPDAPVIDEEAVVITASWPGGSAEVNIDTKTRSIRYCDCPLQRNDLSDEAFEGGFPPGGWTVVDNLQSGRVLWVRNDEIDAYNDTTGSGYCAAVSSVDNYPLDAELRTATLDVSGLDPDASIMLEFNYSFSYYEGYNEAFVDYSFDRGAAWTNAWTFGSEDSSSNKKTLNLGARQGDELLIRFRFIAARSFWKFLVDNVRVYACLPPGSGVAVCPVDDAFCPGQKTRAVTIHNFNSEAESFSLGYSIDAGQITGPSEAGPVASGGSETFSIETIMPYGSYGSIVTAFVNATGLSSGDEARGKITTQVGGWISGTSTPFATADNPVFAHDGRIYVFGGMSTSAGKVGIYDPDADSWTLGTALTEHAIPSPECGIIGRNSDGETIVTMFPSSESGRPYLLNIYNIDRDSWTTPAVQTEIGSIIQYAACVSDLENNVGYVVSNGWYPQFFKYYPSDNKVEELAAPPLARSRAAAWLWDGKICLAGGQNTDQETYKDVPLNSTICYDLETGVWNSENADLPALPYTWWGMAYELIDGRPALISGMMGTHGTGAGVWYDPETNEWTFLPAAPNGVLRAKGASLDGRFYLMAGGVPGGVVKSYNQIMMECLDQPEQLTITGTVKTPDGTPIPNATIHAPSYSGITNADGGYSASVPWGWTGSLKVSKQGWVFSPGAINFENLDYNPVDRDFMGLEAKSTGGGKAPGCFVSGIME